MYKISAIFKTWHIKKILHLNSKFFLHFSVHSKYGLQDNCCKNLLSQLAVLFAPGHWTVGYVKPLNIFQGPICHSLDNPSRPLFVHGTCVWCCILNIGFVQYNIRMIFFIILSVWNGLSIIFKTHNTATSKPMITQLFGLYIIIISPAEEKIINSFRLSDAYSCL